MSKLYANTITKNTPLIELAEYFIANKTCHNISCLSCPLITENIDCSLASTPPIEWATLKWAKEYIEEQKKLKYLESLK
jgi:hypothetical protein